MLLRQPGLHCQAHIVCGQQLQHHRCAPICYRRRAGRLNVQAVGWDPEGILAQPKGGHIQRRNLQKQLAEDKELAAEVEKKDLELQAEQQQKRDARQQPASGDHRALVEYFFDTEGQEMQYETARCRPLLTPDFFSYLKSEISTERFSKVVNEDRVTQLEALQSVLEAGAAAVDARAALLMAPAERLKLLLTAKDKKAQLLDMVAANQIDQPLLDLLQQNIDGARAAGLEEPAKFMEKIRAAAQRYKMA